MMGAVTFALVIKGIILGLGAAVPIGPVNVEIARRTLKRGWGHGVGVGGGASSVDVIYAIVASLGWAPLIGNPTLVYILGTAGVVFLLYLAAMCFRGVIQSLRPAPALEGNGDNPAPAVPAEIAGNDSGVISSYLTGLFMNFLNPMILAFWFVVLPALAAKLTEDPRRELPWMCLGVFLGTMGWVLSFSSVVAVLGRFKRGLWVTLTDAVGGVVLLGFALAAAVRLVRPLF